MTDSASESITKATSERKLSVKNMSAFGIGDTAGAFLSMAWGVTLLFYYQQVVGVDAALVGTAIFIATLVDAISDPLVGAWSDRINTKWGRRHPMLLISTIPLGISFALLFMPPEGMSDTQGFIWLTVFAVLVRFSWTFYQIPHLSLGAELIQTFEDRTKIFAYSAFIQAMSVAVAYGLITAYFFRTTEDYDPGFLNPAGYPQMAISFACVMILAILTCAFGTRDQIPHLRQSEPVSRFSLSTVFTEMWSVLRNSSFRAVFLGTLFASVIAGIESAFTPFLGIHFWGFQTEDLAYLVYVGLFGFPITFYLTPRIVRYLGRRMAVVAPLALWTLAINIPISMRLLDAPWFPSNDSIWVLVIFIAYSYVGALCAPLIGSSVNSMLADIADENELETGVRREGVIYAFRAFTNKVTSSIGILIGGFLLKYIEFPEAATRGSLSEDMIWKVGFIAGPATSIFTLGALGFYFFYRIDRKRHEEILAELAKRKSQEPLEGQ